MIVKNLLLILFFILQNQNASHENIFQFKFNDLDNKLVSFSELDKNKATVFVFLLSDCPASQSYTLTLNKLSKKYSKENIQFIGVFPGKFSTLKELKDFRTMYRISFPLLQDPEMFLPKYLRTTVVPSCYVINEKGIVIYKGRIDDWLYALGKKKQVITENNLDDALGLIIKNLPVKKSETTPIGCILEYENQ